MNKGDTECPSLSCATSENKHQSEMWIKFSVRISHCLSMSVFWAFNHNPVHFFSSKAFDCLHFSQEIVFKLSAKITKSQDTCKAEKIASILSSTFQCTCQADDLLVQNVRMIVIWLFLFHICYLNFSLSRPSPWISFMVWNINCSLWLLVASCVTSSSNL